VLKSEIRYLWYINLWEEEDSFLWIDHTMAHIGLADLQLMLMQLLING
jgi:hypothetical protein